MFTMQLAQHYPAHRHFVKSAPEATQDFTFHFRFAPALAAQAGLQIDTALRLDPRAVGVFFVGDDRHCVGQFDQRI